MPGPGGKLEPSMAKEWSHTPDGLTWTVKLNKGYPNSLMDTIQRPGLEVQFRLDPEPECAHALSRIIRSDQRDDCRGRLHRPISTQVALRPFRSAASILLPVSPKAAEPYDGRKLSRNPVALAPINWSNGSGANA